MKSSIGPARGRKCVFSSTKAYGSLILSGPLDGSSVILRIHLSSDGVVSLVRYQSVPHMYASIDSPLCIERSFSVLGMLPGVLVTLAVASTCLYTSLILGRFCMKHPEMRDICDIGQYLFGGSQLAYNLTSIMFILNNVFIQGVIASLDKYSSSH